MFSGPDICHLSLIKGSRQNVNLEQFVADRKVLNTGFKGTGTLRRPLKGIGRKRGRPRYATAWENGLNKLKSKSLLQQWNNEQLTRITFIAREKD